jgi:hypothetical protein
MCLSVVITCQFRMSIAAGSYAGSLQLSRLGIFRVFQVLGVGSNVFGPREKRRTRPRIFSASTNEDFPHSMCHSAERLLCRRSALVFDFWGLLSSVDVVRIDRDHWGRMRPDRVC